MILRRAVELSRGQTTSGGEALSTRLSQYAAMLAAQGSLATASSYLRDTNNDVSMHTWLHLHGIQGDVGRLYLPGKKSLLCAVSGIVVFNASSIFTGLFFK